MPGHQEYGLLSGIEAITEGIRVGLDAVLQSTGWSLSDEEARDAVETLCRARARLEAAYLHALRVLDDRPDALDGAGKGKVAATFLIGRLHVDGATAASDVRAAKALDPDTGGLSQMGAALAAGETSREHVDVAVAAVAKLPKAVLAQQLPVTGADVDRDATHEAADDAEAADDSGSDAAAAMSGAQFVDGWLSEHARRVQPRTLKAMARGLRDRLDPDHEDRSFDPDGFAKRSVHLHVDRFTGMATLRATLLAADAAQLAAFLRSASKPAPPVETLREEPDGGTTAVEVRDERGVDMRRYDALFTLLRAAFAGRLPATAAPACDTAAQAAAAAATDAASDAEARTRAGGGDGASADTKADVAAGGVDASTGADPAAGLDSGNGAAISSGASVPVQLLVTATLDQVAAAAALNTGSPVPATFAAAGRAHLDRVGDLDPSLLTYLSCTATVQRLLLDPHSRPLDLGRSVRFATLSQRRAAAVRDGGCVIPYCPCPADDVDLHHLLHWALGGPTDLTNLASVCSRHHQETHAGIWTIEVRQGVVWVKPPPWIDPQQRWLRAPRRTREEAIRRAAEQLRLHLDDAA